MDSSNINAGKDESHGSHLGTPILPCREVLDHTLSLFHPDGKRLTVEAVESVARGLSSTVTGNGAEHTTLREGWVAIAARVLNWTSSDSSLFFDFFCLFDTTLAGPNASNAKPADQVAKFVVFLFAQLYQHTDGADRRGRMLMAQERAAPEDQNGSGDAKATTREPQRYKETPVSLLSPSSAKTLAKQTHVDDRIEQTKFLKDNIAQLIGILRDSLPPLVLISRGQVAALEMIMSTHNRTPLLQCLPMFRAADVVRPDLLITHLKTRFKPHSNIANSPSPPRTQSKNVVNAPAVLSSVGDAANVSLYGVQRSTKIHLRQLESNGDEGSNSSMALPDLHIAHNEKSSIYVLQPFRFGTISGCTDCIIVVGAVEAVLSLERCERVTLIASCKQLRIGNCFDCKCS